MRAHLIARIALTGVIAMAAVTASFGGMRVASADDRVASLAKLLESSSSDKQRLAAIAALARLGDRRAMKPLVGALHDPNAQVRAIAAAALGKLGHRAALPSLRNAAVDDVDADVRARAREAASAVAKANQLPDPFPPEPAEDKPVAAKGKKRGRAGFGNQPRALEPSPDVFVTINSANDDSPGKADKATRKTHAAILKETLATQLRAHPLVTTDVADAKRFGIDPRHLDLSVIKMDVSQVGAQIEIEAQLRLAISDHNGKMLSFLSGGAKVQVPKRTFDAKYLPVLRREALENAMRGMFDKLLVQLRDKSQS